MHLAVVCFAFVDAGGNPSGGRQLRRRLESVRDVQGTGWCRRSKVVVLGNGSSTLYNAIIPSPRSALYAACVVCGGAMPAQVEPCFCIRSRHYSDRLLGRRDFRSHAVIRHSVYRTNESGQSFRFGPSVNPSHASRLNFSAQSGSPVSRTCRCWGL